MARESGEYLRLMTLANKAASAKQQANPGAKNHTYAKLQTHHQRREAIERDVGHRTLRLATVLTLGFTLVLGLGLVALLFTAAIRAGNP